MPRELRRVAKRSPWLYKVTIVVLGTCSVALLSISVIISNAIQSSSVLEGMQVQSLRRPDTGDRSGQMDGMVQNQKHGNNQPDTTDTTKQPTEQGARDVQRAGKEPAPVENSRRMLNSEIYQPDTTTGRRLVTIPKILVQSYTDVAMVPPKVYENVRTYAPGWDHLIFDDGNATAFLDKHFDSGVAARFRNLTEGAHKADLFRYAFLYVHGGVWLDMDVELRAPLKDALERENTIYTAKSGVFDDIFQAVLAVPPKVPFMKRLVEEIVESDLNGRGLPFTVWFKKALLRSTGQARLQVGKVMESKKSDERVTDFYLFRETCSRSTTAKCPVLDKYGLCCWVMDGSKVIFKARYHDYPFK
mmetsp:Transcript_11803/g.25740  ORF Transcript_11803/g.25740 Transcript_11803/m.25740 type:complete len:359 (-) Transcript_11803:219-1295(-)